MPQVHILQLKKICVIRIYSPIGSKLITLVLSTVIIVFMKYIKRKKRFLLFYLIIVIAMDMGARSFTINLPESSFEVTHFNELEFSELLEDGTLSSSNQDFNRRGFSSIYQDGEEAFLLEFYFGGAIKLSNAGDLEKIKRVSFLQMQTWEFGDELTYFIRLSQEEYDLMKQEAEPYVFESEYIKEDVVSSFMKNDGSLLIHAKHACSFSGFNLYEGFKSLAAQDVDTGAEIEDLIELKKYKGEYEPLYKKNWIPFAIDIQVDRNVNAEDARRRLSNIYNVDLEELDYTEGSLTKLDYSIIENWNRVDANDVFLLFVSYIGEIVVRNHNLTWGSIKKGASDHIFLIKDDGAEYDLEHSLNMSMFNHDWLITYASDAYIEIEKDLCN